MESFFARRFQGLPDASNLFVDRGSVPRKSLKKIIIYIFDFNFLDHFRTPSDQANRCIKKSLLKVLFSFRKIDFYWDLLL